MTVRYTGKIRAISGRLSDGIRTDTVRSPLVLRHGLRTTSISYIYKHPIIILSITVANSMANPPRHLRLAILRLQLAEARGRYNAILAALIVEEERVRRRQRQRRRWWIRPWLERRLMYGQYETLMVELEMEHEADFKSFLRSLLLFGTPVDAPDATDVDATDGGSGNAPGTSHHLPPVPSGTTMGVLPPQHPHPRTNPHLACLTPVLQSEA